MKRVLMRTAIRMDVASLSAMSAQRRWRKLHGFRQLADVIAGVNFIDGVDGRTISRKTA